MAPGEVRGTTRPVCSRCGAVVYLNPKLAVAVIVEMDGKLLLQRRAIEPGMGKWSFPSGYVDRGEVVEEAAVREVREETGMEVALGSLVGLYSEPGNPVVLAVYVARATGGQLGASDNEVHEVGLFSPDALPPLAFPHDTEIIRHWRTEHARPKGLG
ncbi:MAG: NUDIX domain-containing protein [Chloroflexi bacterium]|nr:NUDIX domain-containing protein [Chloroflexota bacterium]